MVRAMGERENGVFIRNKIVEAMWKDVVLRTKHLGHTNRRLMNKQIWELSKQFEFSLFAYDEGITSDDKQLASTIWTHFFNRNCDDYVQVELMVKYIRANVSIWSASLAGGMGNEMHLMTNFNFTDRNVRQFVQRGVLGSQEIQVVEFGRILNHIVTYTKSV